MQINTIISISIFAQFSLWTSKKCSVFTTVTIDSKGTPITCCITMRMSEELATWKGTCICIGPFFLRFTAIPSLFKRKGIIHWAFNRCCGLCNMKISPANINLFSSLLQIIKNFISEYAFDIQNFTQSCAHEGTGPLIALQIHPFCIIIRLCTRTFRSLKVK